MWWVTCWLGSVISTTQSEENWGTPGKEYTGHTCADTGSVDPIGVCRNFSIFSMKMKIT